MKIILTREEAQASLEDWVNAMMAQEVPCGKEFKISNYYELPYELKFEVVDVEPEEEPDMEEPGVYDPKTEGGSDA